MTLPRIALAFLLASTVACGATVAPDASTDAGVRETGASTFPCGSVTCALNTQYCQRTTSDIAGQPDSYVCRPLPSSCEGSPTCACVASEPCGTQCAIVSGGVSLTCPGG